MAVLVFLWLAAEGLFALLPARFPMGQGEPVPLQQSDFVLPDEDLGYRLAPNNVARHRKQLGDEVQYDVQYSIDERGRRYTPAPLAPVDEFLIFFGCSNTFGEGLPDQQTIPSLISQLDSSRAAYNYGMRGYGPAQMLEILKRPSMPSELSEPTGFMFYLFIPSHIGRAIGSSNVACCWARDFPHYVLDPAGKPVRMGTFHTARPLTDILYRWLSASRILQWFEFVLPARFASSDYELVAGLFAEASQLARSRLRAETYIILLPSAGPGDETVNEKMRTAMDKAGVRWVDLSKAFDLRKAEYHLAANDYHHSAAANRLLAPRILEIASRHDRDGMLQTNGSLAVPPGIE